MIEILFIASMFVCLMNLIGLGFKVSFPTILGFFDPGNVYIMYPCWIFQIWFWADRLIF